MKKNKTYSGNFINKIIDKDLANGKYTTIHTRFPPEPNGYLHIGHAKSICLNFGLAKDYQGKCNLRIDDTNPAKENIKYIESIKNDIQWLGFKWSGKVCYSSDYFNQLYSYAIELINKNLAYVDELSIEEIREYRGTLTKPGKNSPYRNRSIKENLLLFEKMRIGNFEEGKACLRAKIDMSSPFTIMRDPVLYRIKFINHHQTGNKWCIYPMYDFANCISDAIEGITHSLCTLEFQDNRRLYNWILSNVSILKYPQQYEFSRLNLEYTVMSKRKLNLLVLKKYVDGWDDPRMPTISGLRRRGYTSSSIRKFCNLIGITKQDNIIKMSVLESCIREDLNNNAPRVMVVIDPIKIVIENYPKESDEVINMYNHPNKPEMGSRQVPFSSEIWIDRADFCEKFNNRYKRLTLHKEVRLRNAYIIRAEHLEKDKSGKIITIYCKCDLNSLRKNPNNSNKIGGVIHWVSIKHALSVEIRLYNRLFNIPNPNIMNEDFSYYINHKSLIVKQGYAEPSLKDAKIGQNYQFEREGYFCLDKEKIFNNKLIFNRTVSLRNIENNKIIDK